MTREPCGPECQHEGHHHQTECPDKPPFDGSCGCSSEEHLEAKLEDENYGPITMGRSEGTAISLPYELRDGGVIDFSNHIPIGWEYDGVLHFFKGRGPQDFPPGWTYLGEMKFTEEEP